ncbi:MAG: hypothetical protein ACI9EW_000942 [Cellvibrionaceae bacterium]|jgi:hypothetical protein
MKFVEELIKNAQRQGEFQGLKGEGERLVLDENPFTAETRLAYGIIKQAGYRPSFIDNRKAIKDKIEVTCDLLRHSSESWTGTQWSQLRWDQAVIQFREAAIKLNRQIRDYNLKAPSEQFFIIPIDPDREVKRFLPKNIDGG